MARGNNPKRRPVANGTVPAERIDYLKENATYSGVNYHKKNPGDYGFRPPVAPRPHKSLCDEMRVIMKGEAQELLLQGIALCMFGTKQSDTDLPKYIWSVDDDNEVYEAKIGSDRTYHGYRLGSTEETVRCQVLKEWKKRCREV